MATMYILLTAKGKFYVGSTEDLGKRLAVHSMGKVKTTKSQLPVTLVYQEEFSTRGDAQRREYQIKKWKSSKLIKSLIESRGTHTASSSNG